MARLYSYIVASDSGSAPNPFHGFCTLAICKPSIRRTAQTGDYIVGLGGKARGWPVIYAMRVTDDKLTFDEYWDDPRFVAKRPDISVSGERGLGDNIYCWDTARGKWHQEPSVHTPRHIPRDTGGKYVLISEDFIYWGSQSPPSPKFHADLLVGLGDKPMTQGHRCNFRDGVVEAFIQWFEQQEERGRLGMPFDWEEDADTPLCVPRRRPRKKC